MVQLTAQDETDLLTALHDGPFEQPLWMTFLERVRVRTRSGHAGLLFRAPDPAGQLVALYAGAPPPPVLRSVAAQPGARRDGRVYAADELSGDAGSPPPLRALRVTEESGVVAWLTIARDAPDYRAGDAALLAALAPHLRRALRSFVAIERARFTADTAAATIRRLNYGWLALDVQGCVIDRDAQAERLLQRLPQLRSGRTGRLLLADPALDRQFAAILRACASDPAARPRALTVSREPWIDMLVVPSPGAADSPGIRPVAIAYVHADSLSTEDRHGQIAELFGLLPSEARLALALSRGDSLAQAAVSLGLTIETARNYSKKIYAKMGARGQGDLIRFILGSTLALA